MRSELLVGLLISLIVGEVSSSEKVLSRKRRWLTFPEGSSFQVIYDQTIPVFSFPLVYTIGVTVAIAYELPSQPWYEIAKKIRQNIRNGEYLIKKDKNASALTYVDTKVAKNEFQPQLNLLQTNANPQWTQPSYYYQEKPTYYSPSKPVYYSPTKTPQISSKKDYYFGNKQNNYISNFVNQLSYLTNKYMSSKPGFSKAPIYWSDVVKQFKQAANRKQYVAKPNPKTKMIYPKHKRPINPIFGKRSISDDINIEHLEKHEDIVFRQYHRKTRHDLFTKIETYLNSKGLNGKECVLRTLCETGHKEMSADLPNTFLSEIFKAVFKLPAIDDGYADDKHRDYDLAHSANGNCSDLYPRCKGDLWSSHLLF